MTQEPNAELVELLKTAERILVFTGAGVSTNSGIPDYRGPSGLWKVTQPVMYQDFMTSETKRIEYWTQKEEGWPLFRDAKPNGLHYGIVDLEKSGKLTMCVTQNIDGLHGKAGTSKQRLVELHGTGRRIECQSCRARTDPEPHFESFRATKKPPACSCGGWLKPATISFGQKLRSEDLKRAGDATQVADLVVAMGSSLSVHPAAAIPLAAAQRGAPYAIINRGQTDHDNHPSVSLRLDGDVETIFVTAVTAALAS